MDREKLLEMSQAASRKAIDAINELRAMRPDLRITPELAAEIEKTLAMIDDERKEDGIEV
jgi:hypothetical protein